MELSASIENYLETMYRICIEKRRVRVKEISATLGVSMPSVNAAVKNLAEKGLVHFEKYGSIELTEAGTREGRRIFAAHGILMQFFHDVLGIDLHTAEENACRIEHHINRDVLSRIKLCRDYVVSIYPDDPDGWARSFESYAAKTAEKG